MKVVILNDASIARGGATGLSLLQARLLRERGIPVTFIAGDALDNPDLAATGATHVNLGGLPLMKSHPLRAATLGLYDPAMRDGIADFIARQDDAQTVYHVHSWSKALTPSLFSALRPVAARVFIHAHDFFLACPNGGYMNYPAMRPCELRPLSPACLASNCDKRSRAQKAWRVTRQAILRRTMPTDAPWGGILMIHPGMRPYLEKVGYPGHLLYPLRNPAERLTETRVRAEAGTRLLFAGRVEAEKGIEDLVAAAARAGAPLTVVGDGPLLEPLRAAHPGVRFTGWMDRAGLAAEMATARALVMPSRYPEPFGLVAAEAVMSGLPAMVSHSALLARELAETGLGWSVNARDPVAFADGLRAVMDTPPDVIADMSRRGFDAETPVCTTPDAWIDGQIELWRGALQAD
ncbi:glycosyltransferase family 4 protein [Jannaschia pohangensis]|uniref:Glycosyltransferase involved in cell wall bisynthesis n=1 Tax=Jannaschia pohangensis TaxID=390807 RepID=A0A1I3QTG6_9RHOB|nr:glycosyltransferase family 4 protein [Jannaschia pohangensis]SFJ37195.1 Glycosyltransferase involved in cell wall bisynthesis [Jannaschia pohangensis]